MEVQGQFEGKAAREVPLSMVGMQFDRVSVTVDRRDQVLVQA